MDIPGTSLFEKKNNGWIKIHAFMYSCNSTVLTNRLVLPDHLVPRPMFGWKTGNVYIASLGRYCRYFVTVCFSDWVNCLYILYWLLVQTTILRMILSRTLYLQCSVIHSVLHISWVQPCSRCSSRKPKPTTPDPNVWHKIIDRVNRHAGIFLPVVQQTLT